MSGASETAMLFVPAAVERRFRALDRWPGRSFILDLEDSVPPDEKPRARQLAARLVAERGASVSLHVRVNAPSSAAAVEDVEAVVGPGLAGIVAPKVQSEDDARRVDELIARAEDRRGLSRGSVRLMATIETAAGLAAVGRIAAAPRVDRLAFGAGDFALDLGLEWPDERGPSPTLLHAQVEVVLASRVAGLLAPHDGAYPRYTDAAGLRAEAERARRLGFGGKHVVHPDQIPVVEEAFRPTAAAVERARRMVAAFDQATARGEAAVGIDGELVDEAIVRRARQVLGAAGE